MRSPRPHPARPARSRTPATAARDGGAVAPTFAGLLKAWRSARRYSQLELASETEVSQRHLSFMESGRANPSRDMVLHLSQVLRVPLRERNDMLLAAGYAPLYPERALNDASMAGIRRALETTLRHHEPFPGLVVDRQWNVLMHNAAVDRLIGLLGPPARVWKRVDPSGSRNLMRLTLHPKGLRPLVVDWRPTAAALLARLQAELQANPASAGLRALLAELHALPGMPTPAEADAAPPMQVPVLSLKLRRGDATLELFSMVCTFGTALDLTADELRLELLFPGDDTTAQFLRSAEQRA